jgi:hypothetical protein
MEVLPSFHFLTKLALSTSHDSVGGICIRDDTSGINNEKRTKEVDYGPLLGHGEPCFQLFIT